MSGHSHYATIKRQKETKDAQKGKAFSKLGMSISLAVKAGGGPDPAANSKLRFAIEQARAFNMPKDNIERAISKASAGQENLEEVTYEGFGPNGIAVVVEAATDNRNRTGQEIKNLFERGGGSLSGPGSVSFNFERKGMVVVEKQGDFESQFLKLIDLGVEDVEDTDSGIEVYVLPDKLSETTDLLTKSGFKVLSFELVRKPKNYTTISEPEKASKALSFLDNLEEHDDVQKVFANLNIPQETVAKLD